MGILRQKIFLKAEKKRKRKREEAEKMKQDLTVDISQQAPQMVCEIYKG
jgi:hypothetical protein